MTDPEFEQKTLLSSSGTNNDDKTASAGQPESALHKKPTEKENTAPTKPITTLRIIGIKANDGSFSGYALCPFHTKNTTTTVCPFKFEIKAPTQQAASDYAKLAMAVHLTTTHGTTHPKYIDS